LWVVIYSQVFLTWVTILTREVTSFFEQASTDVYTCVLV